MKNFFIYKCGFKKEIRKEKDEINEKIIQKKRKALMDNLIVATDKDKK